MNDTHPPFALQDDEIRQVAALLSKLEPGFLPFNIFHQVARLAALPFVEVAPFRLRDGRVEILLLEREADDPIWPGQLHVPGVVVRASDTPGTFADALHRTIDGELAGVAMSAPVFVKSFLYQSGRGLGVSQLYWAEVTGEVPSSIGNFYDAENLPENFIQSQLAFMPDLVAHFKMATSQEP